MTQINENIAAGIAAAQAAAGELATQTLDLVPLTPANGNGVTTYAAPQAATLDGFLDAGSSLKPDYWLQTSAFGFTVKGNEGLVKLDAPMLMTCRQDLVPFFGIRINIGGKPTYYKTVDHVRCQKTGRPWAEIVNMASQAGQTEYMGFDIRLTATKDIKGDNGVAVPAGKSVGFSTSVTNFDDIANFARQVKEAGQLGTPILVKVKCEKRTNDKNPSGWGALVVEGFEPQKAAA